MRKELDDLLAERYPDLFCERQASPVESGMHYGFACGDGWFDLINNLCNKISSSMTALISPPVVVTQVKEKFGRLRFHFRGGNDEVRRVVQLAEDLSETICENCGRSGATHISAKQQTLCPACQTRANTPIS